VEAEIALTFQYVVDYDIYDLDGNDNDGVGCE
jgi:hypothetical protein